MTPPTEDVPARFRDRPTGDLLVMMIAFTICFAVIASGLAVALVEIFHPESDTTAWISRISGILNTLIGLLAGFLAGRANLPNLPPLNGKRGNGT